MQAPHKEHLYKLLVIGDLGVGKTSIIKRYVHQNFSSHYRATIGVDFALKVLHWDPETVVRLQLWDIAGELPRRGRGPERLTVGLKFWGIFAAEWETQIAGALSPKTFPGGLETWFSRKQKSFSLSKKLQVHSLALSGCCFNSLPHLPLGSLGPARASPGTQKETIWTGIQFSVSSSFSGPGQACW